jgi:SAM-dependent methyltransferase
MAIPLLKYLNNSGGYIGFDISKRAIRWCKKNITSKNPKFSFYLADIYNKAYNHRGKLTASEYKFPFEDERIDFAFATSVFTHMMPKDLRHYLFELERSLKPGGRAMLTFFIIDDKAHQMMNENESSFNFKYKNSDCYSIDGKVPEIAIAFSENTLWLHKKWKFLKENTCGAP